MDSNRYSKIMYPYVLCVLVAGSLCFTQIIGTASLIYLNLLAFLGVVAFYTSKNFALPVLLFFLPWCKILRISPTSYSFFTMALLLVCIVNLIHYNFRIKRNPLTIGIILAFITLWSKLLTGGELEFSYVMFLFMIILFPMIKEEQRLQSYDFFVLVLFLSTGVVMASLCAQWFASHGNIAKYIRVDSYHVITRRCGFYGDPNFYNAQITAAMSGCMIVILHIRQKGKAIMLGVLLMILLYCGLLSGSKSFILVFLAMLLLWLFQIGKIQGRLWMKSIMVISVTGFSVFVLTSPMFGKLIDVIITRLSFSNNISDFTTGRTELWNMYIDFILEDWRAFLFGIGYSGVKVNGLASHSTILQMWYQFGLTGSILLIIWCANFMSLGSHKIINGQRLNIIIIVVGVFVPWLAIDMLFFDEFFLFQLYVTSAIADVSIPPSRSRVSGV